MSNLRINYKLLAADLTNAVDTGQPIHGVMIAHGYSEKQARKGWSNVPQKAIKLMSSSARGKRLRSLGTINPQDQEKLVRGRLVENCIEGKDSGSMSAKILGSEKSLSMWQPDIQSGIVFINAPACALADREKLLNPPEE